jgi:hypothetical protein
MRLFNACEGCRLRLSGVVGRVRGPKAWEDAQRGRTRTRSDRKASSGARDVVDGKYLTNQGDRCLVVNNRQCLVYSP